MPADINDLKKPYRIDAAFNKLPPPSGWANAWHDQKAFGRRALEVAIVSASDVGFDDPRTGLTDCRSIVKLADQAKQRLDILLGHLGPNVRHLESHLRALAIAGPLKILRAGAGGAVDEPRERRTQAKRDAQTLVGASESLGRIIADAAEKARRIKLHTQNPGNPAKTEFVGRLAEAWSCLKGRRPPASMEPRTNAFLQLAAAAWADAHRLWAEPEENFTRAMQAARRRLTDDEVRRLHEVGPTWL